MPRLIRPRLPVVASSAPQVASIKHLVHRRNRSPHSELSYVRETCCRVMTSTYPPDETVAPALGAILVRTLIHLLNSGANIMTINAGTKARVLWPDTKLRIARDHTPSLTLTVTVPTPEPERKPSSAPAFLLSNKSIPIILPIAPCLERLPGPPQLAGTSLPSYAKTVPWDP